MTLRELGQARQDQKRAGICRRQTRTPHQIRSRAHNELPDKELDTNLTMARARLFVDVRQPLPATIDSRRTSGRATQVLSRCFRPVVEEAQPQPACVPWCVMRKIADHFLLPSVQRAEGARAALGTSPHSAAMSFLGDMHACMMMTGVPLQQGEAGRCKARQGSGGRVRKRRIHHIWTIPGIREQEQQKRADSRTDDQLAHPHMDKGRGQVYAPKTLGAPSNRLMGGISPNKVRDVPLSNCCKASIVGAHPQSQP